MKTSYLEENMKRHSVKLTFGFSFQDCFNRSSQQYALLKYNCKNLPLHHQVDDEVKEVTESEDIDSEEVGELLKSLELGLMGVSGDIEEGRKRVSEAVEDKEETAKNLRKLVSPKSSQENGESSRRKRRSANSDDSADEEVEVDAKTIDEVCGKTKQTGQVKSVMAAQNCL